MGVGRKGTVGRRSFAILLSDSGFGHVGGRPTAVVLAPSRGADEFTRRESDVTEIEGIFLSFFLSFFSFLLFLFFLSCFRDSRAMSFVDVYASIVIRRFLRHTGARIDVLIHPVRNAYTYTYMHLYIYIYHETKREPPTSRGAFRLDGGLSKPQSEREKEERRALSFYLPTGSAGRRSGVSARFRNFVRARLGGLDERSLYRSTTVFSTGAGAFNPRI